MRIARFASVTSLAAAALLLAGCGSFGTTVVPTSLEIKGMQGSAFGGQQPVNGATIQLYQVGTTGYGTGATPLISSTVKSDTGGFFTLTGTYACTAGTQVYITATGGNPGAGTNNSLALMAGLGLCDNLSASTFIQMNEITTVGTVWALSPFMTGANVGAPTTNQAGLTAAFADINLVTNIATGKTPGAALPAGATAPTSEINTLADIIASCVNSTGAGDGGACDKLFANATSSAGTVPTDTITAAVNMARQPGKNVATLLSLSTSTAPFQPTLALNDFTVGVTFSGSGLNAPSAVAVDASNNVWVANSGGNSVSEFSHVGAPLSGTAGYTGSLNAPSGIAIAANGNVWVSNAGNSTLTELTSAGANASGSPFSGGGLSTPSAVAIDALGYIWLSNKGNSTVSAFLPSGSAFSPTAGFAATGLAAPVGIAVNPR